MTLCNRRDYARRPCALRHRGCQWKWSLVFASCSARNHECCHWRTRHALSHNHRCCHWRPRHALSRNHIQVTVMNFSLLVPILILLSDCINSSSLFPVAILCTLLHRENTSFEVRYLHTPSVTVDRRQL